MIKKFTLFIALLFSLNVSFANDKEINILRFAPPGGNVAVWTDAIIDTLEKNGYKSTLISFKNCKEGFKWTQEHPNEPSIFWGQSQAAILDNLDPENPATCGFPVNEENLVTIISKWWTFICGHKDVNDNFDVLMNKHSNIAIYNHPISVSVFKAQMKALDVKANILTFTKPKDQLQAFISGDADYIVLNNENLAKSVSQASCFGTTASPEDAKLYQTGRISYSEKGDVPFIGYGNWPLIQAKNVDIVKMRNIFTFHQSDMMKSLISTMRPVTTSVENQLKEINEMTKQLKAIQTQ